MALTFTTSPRVDLNTHDDSRNLTSKPLSSIFFYLKLLRNRDGAQSDRVQVSRMSWFAPFYLLYTALLHSSSLPTTQSFLTADTNTRAFAYFVQSLAPIPFPALGTLHHAIWGHRGTTAGCTVNQPHII